MGFLLLILGTVLGCYLFGWLRIPFTYLILRMRGMTCTRVAGLFLRWDKDYYDPEHPGKMKFSVSPRLNQLYPTILMHKRMEKGSKKNGIVFLIIDILLTVGFLVAFIVLQIKSLGDSDDLLLPFLCGLCIGGFSLFLTISHQCIKMRMDPTELNAKTAEITESLAFAEKVEDIVAKPFAYPSYVNASIGEKCLYLITFYRAAEIRNDLAAMAECVKAMTELRTLTLTAEGHFYLDSVLYSYFAFRQKDPERAKQSYEHSKQFIDADKDANGRRNLAYYYFYVLNDKESARKYAEEALQALSADDPRVSKIGNDFEEKMIRYLLSQIDA